jgi:hypothetical protein
MGSARHFGKFLARKRYPDGDNIPRRTQIGERPIIVSRPMP